jgi:hypothetical protein
LFRQAAKASNKSVHPGLRKGGGKGQRQERGDWLSPHGCDVAQSPGKATMTDRLGLVPVPSEVDAFKGKVGGDQNVVSRPGAQYGAVVSNAGHEPDSSAPGRIPSWQAAGQECPAYSSLSRTDAADQRFFSKRHDATTIAEARPFEARQHGVKFNFPTASWGEGQILG